MTLLSLWLHVLGVVVWMGGLTYQAHVLAPAARRDGAATFAASAARGRVAAWAALAVTVLTGFYNVTRLGSLERVMESGAALALAGKLLLVIALVALATHRDFGQLPRLRRALDAGEDGTASLRTIAWLDRAALLMAAAIIYLGLFVSRHSVR